MSDKKELLVKLKGLESSLKKSNAVMCDAECQNNNKKRVLYDSYLKAKSNYENGAKNYRRKEKEFYIGTNQRSYYNTLQENRAKESITEYMNNIEKMFNEDIDRLNIYLNFYKSQLTYKHNFDDLKDHYVEKKKNLEKKEKKTKFQKNIDDRLSNFYDINNESLSYWSKGVLFYLYWIMVLITIVILILKKQIRNPKVYPFVLSLIILPFLIHPVYKKILTTMRHFKLDNIYFIFILFSLFLLLVSYTSYKFAVKMATPMSS